MAEKRHAPIEQLREAGKIARQMLRDKNIEAKRSILDELVHTKGAPIPPGIPAYLPRPHTLKVAQRAMRDIIIRWKDYNKKTPDRVENISEFFKFVLREMDDMRSGFNQQMMETARLATQPALMGQLAKIPVLSELFLPMRAKENTGVIRHFFYDSFAVAVVCKKNHTTSEYANWFLDWSQELYLFWLKPEERKNFKPV